MWALYHVLCCYLGAWHEVATQQIFDAKINAYFGGPSLKVPPFAKSQSVFNHHHLLSVPLGKNIAVGFQNTGLHSHLGINLLYDLEQVIISLQMIFKFPLIPDLWLFAVSLLLSPWSNLNRSNLLLTNYAGMQPEIYWGGPRFPLCLETLGWY